jgi:hypothetical protein
MNPVVTIHNLPSKYTTLMNVVWAIDSTDKIATFIQSLPTVDQHAMNYLIGLAVNGGDEVKDVSTARAILDKIRSR